MKQALSVVARAALAVSTAALTACGEQQPLTAPAQAYAPAAPRFSVAGSSAIAPLLSVGFFHTCALRNDGTMVCWGSNNYGESTVPTGVTSFSRVSANLWHTCALETSGTVACWGNNDYGQASAPSGLSSISDVSVGAWHSCALKTDGTVVCWGLNNYEETAVPDGLASVSQISAGFQHTCALKGDGTVTCWGWGYGAYNQSSWTTVPEGLDSVLQVSAGAYHSCALKTDGMVVCWGFDGYGQTNVPDGLTSVSQVSAGGYVTCALKVGGTVVCWGYDGYGQTNVPDGLTSVSQVSVGQGAACALKLDGTVVCWGWNTFGQASVPSGLNLIVTPRNHPPVANASGPYQGSEGSPVSFDGSASTDPDGDALTYSWDFGDHTAAVTGATPSHIYTDNGTYTATLTVSDGTASTTATTTATIADVAPALSAIAGATILRGETFSSGGAFTDPGLDTWSATVDYGDGSGAQTLSLSGKGFGLSHVYGVAGTYAVTVTVTDDDGGSGVGHATVVVQSPQQALQAVLDAIANLVNEGALSRGNGNALTASLQAAIAQLERGNTTAAANQLGAFLNKATAMGGSGQLPEDAAQDLMAAVRRILTAL